MLRCVFTGIVAVCLLLAANRGVEAGHKPLTREEQDKVDQAIERGVKFLKSHQYHKGGAAGTWPPYPPDIKAYRIGYTFMPTLALLESGVPPDDPVLERAAKVLRRTAPTLRGTYEISLAILILDRLNDPADTALLTELAIRLIAGQKHTGGWSYTCPKLTAKTQDTLLKLLLSLESKKVDGNRSPPKASEVPAAFQDLPIFQNPTLLPWQERVAGGGVGALGIGETDNSNTQFALLGLWAAGRHGIPVARSLLLAVQRFEKSQRRDGTWGYCFALQGMVNESPSPAMTTVGLLALAIKRALSGAEKEQDQGGIDSDILFAFAALSRSIGKPFDRTVRPPPMEEIYFLWSVERIGVLYKLDLLADKDWYRWGTQVLVANQLRSGAWPQGTYRAHTEGAAPQVQVFQFGPVVNTSFALLFLKRSNLTKDLTTKLLYKPEELNKGIVQAFENPQAIPRPKRTPSQRSQEP